MQPRRLLVHSYFCPDNPHRPGGVQQIVGPLISALREEFAWSIEVAHVGLCHAVSGHHILPAATKAQAPDFVDPPLLIQAGKALRKLERDFDVLLSIDRALPTRVDIPALLMANTINYQSEVSAVQSRNWSRIVVPTRHFGARVASICEDIRIEVVPYGIAQRGLSELSDTAPHRIDASAIVTLPHRPDSRKGHIEAIRGLANALPQSSNITLEIAWLDEPRYSSFRGDLTTIIHELRLEKQVCFHTWTPAEVHWQRLASTFGSLQVGKFEESFGISMLESVIAGRPVVTCSQPAVCEVLGQTDFHIEISNPIEWYEYLTSFWAQKLNWQALRRTQLRLAGQYTIGRMAKAYDRIMRTAIEKGQ